jgi:hypothetical protein
MSDEQNVWQPQVSAGHLKRCTKLAPLTDAIARSTTVQFTTSNIGKMGAPPTSATCFHSVHGTITPPTKAVGSYTLNLRPES